MRPLVSLGCGVLACLLLGAGAAVAQPAQTVFACGFGAKRVLIQKVGQTLTYEFGAPGKPELRLAHAAGSGKVTYRRELFPRAINVQLRFQNADVSYVVFHREYFGTANHDGAEEYDGLLVLKGGRALAKLRCKAGMGFTEVDLDALPGEPDDAHYIDRYL